MSSTHSSTRNRAANEEAACKYRTDSESNLVTLVFECRGCFRKGDLEDEVCMRGTLAALKTGFDTDALVLADYIETKYSRPVVEMLMRTAKIMNEAERFALRKPWQSPALRKDKRQSEQQKMCIKCPIKPSSLFGQMKVGAAVSREHLFRTFNSSIERLNAVNKIEGCRNCIEISRGELLYIQRLLKELRTYVLYHAFKIVEGGS
jgi:hypothetical protein